MTAAKFIESPWEVRISADFMQIVSRPTKTVICDLGLAPADDWPLVEKQEANATAHLIAAAPELYQSLHDVMLRFGPGTLNQGLFERATAALMKAEGRS